MALKPCKECGKDVAVGAEKCPHCGIAWPAGKKTGPVAMGCLAFIVFALVFGIVGSMMETDGGAGAPSAPRVAVRSGADIALDSLEISTFTWSAEGFGNVMEASFTITNSGHAAVKDLVITCQLSAKSGTKIDDTRTTIYDVVPAGKKKRFAKVNMGFMNSQAESASCRIVGVSLA